MEQYSRFPGNYPQGSIPVDPRRRPHREREPVYDARDMDRRGYLEPPYQSHDPRDRSYRPPEISVTPEEFPAHSYNPELGPNHSYRHADESFDYRETITPAPYSPAPRELQQNLTENYSPRMIESRSKFGTNDVAKPNSNLPWFEHALEVK